MSTKEKYEQTKLPMVQIRDVVIFPFMMVPFVIGRESSVQALEAALRGDKRIFLATQHDATVDNPKPNEIYQVGTISNIVQSLKLPDGNTKVLVEGIERARILQLAEEDGFWKANLRLSPFRNQSFTGYDTLSGRLSAQFEQYVKLSQNLNADQALAAIKVDDIGRLADTICSHMVLSIEEKQELIEIFNPVERCKRLADILDVEIEKLHVDRSVQNRVKRQMERAQKEYYLNEKIKAIQRELGKKDEKSEIEELRRKIETSGMPKDAYEKGMQELKRLEMMPPMSAESTVSRNYLDWLLAMPWKKKSREIRDIETAERVLNEDHYGLDKVKERIMEFRGDPSAALLEVLDPEQNSTFQDHYLDVEYDLSQVMFIATANVLHTIPQPLQDRMEILRLPGYTEYEKVEIARRFLIPKQMETNGLRPSNLSFNDEGIKAIIRHYTREAGVRNLEREISSICRKVTRVVVKEGPKNAVTLNDENVVDYIGIPKYRSNRHKSQNEIGFVTGLAWTEVGGEILATEATLMEGKGKLTLTGKLGDVMQESAQAAMSYVRSRAQMFGIPKDFYRRLDLHIHVPEGAIPKDGPSAGITMATSLVSALTHIPVRCDVAMTGEITLRGKVLPIGGVKEKLLAAHRAGIRTIILPKDNEKDLSEIPQNIQDQFSVNLVETMDEVLKVALEGSIQVLEEKEEKIDQFHDSIDKGFPQESVTH